MLRRGELRRVGGGGKKKKGHVGEGDADDVNCLTI